MTNTKTSPPTPEQIAELNASAGTQLTEDIVKLLNACEIDKPPVIAHVLGYVLIQFIMAVETTDEEKPTFSEAGKTAIWILRNLIRHTKYAVGMNNEVIDLRTNKEISPGGLKQ
jgi:hypothetical protein